MSEQIIEAKIEEVTPFVQVPTKLYAEPKPLTAEERREIYQQLSKYYDIERLPLPEDFFDDDVTSERGQIQLQYDAHMVGLLNNGMIEMSKEKEEMYRKRLAHKIELVRQMKNNSEESVSILDG